MLTLPFLVLIFSCSAMDLIMEIRGIEEPDSVVFIYDDLAVIGGKNGTALWSLIINEERAYLAKAKTAGLTLSNNRFNIGLLNKKQLTVFGNTGNKKWKKKRINKNTACAFSPVDNILFTYYKGYFSFHNYVTNISYTKKIPSQSLSHKACIACHPAGKELVYTSSDKILSTIQLDEYCNTKGLLTAQNYIIDVTYSPNGEFIAVNDHDHGCFIYNRKTKESTYLKNGYNKHCVAMTFHPQLAILALLMTNNAIQYWNYKTKRIVASRVHTVRNHIRSIPITQRLHFSPNGKQLIVAFNDRCTVLRAPQNNIIQQYWLFKKMGLPRDLIKIIFGKMISFSGLYHFNLVELSLT